MKKRVWESLALACAFAVSANAFTVSGKVSDEQGKTVSGAAVKLLQKGLETTTDDKGEFTLHQDESADTDALPGASLGRVLPGYISVNNGILSYVCTDHNELKHTGAAEMAPVIDYMEVRYYANQNSQ